MSEHEPEANPDPAPTGPSDPEGTDGPTRPEGVGTGAPAEGDGGSSSSNGADRPPAGSSPPPPNAALPPPPASSPPAAVAPPTGVAGPAPEAPRARSGPFGGVIAAGVVTLLVLALVSLWDGGGTGTASPSAPPVVGGGGSGSTVGVPGSAGSDDGSDSSGTGSGSSSVAFDPMALQPPGGVQVPPSSSNVNLEWSVRGTTWRALRDRYQARFPLPGFELGDERMGYGEGDASGQGFDVVPEGGSSIDGVGILSFHDDPSGSGAVLVSYLAR